MKKFIMSVVLSISVLFINNLSYAYFDSSAISIMNFNYSANRDELGNFWRKVGNPILKSNYVGSFLYLDGNSFIQASDTAPFNFPGEFTMEAWIYPIQYVTDNYGYYSFSVFSRWKHGIRTLYFLDVADGKLNFYSDFSSKVSISGFTDIPLNQWSHIAVTRDSKNVIRLFLNGKLENSKTVPLNFTSNDYPMTIGASSNELRKSIGYIDDVHIYKSCKYINDFIPKRN